jgi:hypothetical protein
MYRETQDNKNDLQAICDIYNDITNRNRTADLHSWEWFKSPYKNKSYVLLDQNKNIIGHHGVLTIKTNYKNKTYVAGKTENTIMQKGKGSLYFKNELQMHKEYIKEYDFIITTAAYGVIKKIRTKLGYKYFASYISYIKITTFKTLSAKINNIFLKNIFNIATYVLDLFIFKAKTNNKYIQKSQKIKQEDISDIEFLYNKIKNNIGLSQIRNKEFLKYRVLENPYIDFYVFKLYDKKDFCGYIIYSISNNKVNIEDLLFIDSKIKQELFNRFFNYIKTNKYAGAIIFTTLQRSILDSKMAGFLRVSLKKNKSIVMIKDNKNILTINNLYFTTLTNEGIL